MTADETTLYSSGVSGTSGVAMAVVPIYDPANPTIILINDKTIPILVSGSAVIPPRGY